MCIIALSMNTIRFWRNNKGSVYVTSCWPLMPLIYDSSHMDVEQTNQQNKNKTKSFRIENLKSHAK